MFAQFSRSWNRIFTIFLRHFFFPFARWDFFYRELEGIFFFFSSAITMICSIQDIGSYGLYDPGGQKKHANSKEYHFKNMHFAFGTLQPWPKITRLLSHIHNNKKSEEPSFQAKLFNDDRLLHSLLIYRGFDLNGIFLSPLMPETHSTCMLDGVINKQKMQASRKCSSR